MKKIIIFLALVSIFIIGCANKCGDGICQSFEERKGNCPEDCYALESKESEILNTTEPGVDDILIIDHKKEFAIGSGDYDFSLEHDGLTRTYKVHVPPSYDADSPFPLVIYLHGGGGNADAAYSDGIDKASDKNGFILAAPEGTGEIILGKLRASWNGGEWQTGKCCGDADDVGFISKMIEEIKISFNLDESKVYAMGISNGGLMTNRLACELSDKITAIATVAPAAIPSDCNPVEPVHVIDIHGTGDKCNPFYGREPSFSFCSNVDYTRMTPEQVINKWRKINGCSDESVNGYENENAKCIIYNKCDGGAEVEFCKVEGMGHTWPSGSQYLPERNIGPVSYDISTDQIWEFFEKHSVQ